MSDIDKAERPKARLPRGFGDRGPAEIKAAERLVADVKRVYERYGFEPVETPLIEYADALGKFLPDQDRPNEGVFAFADDDGEWLSLRYDLTAPLARYVAENFERLPKPYRSYRAGWVFRNEKPGPGRFRQFLQIDADTVGAASPAADAEICMMAADTLEALGIARGDYVIRVNNRKVLDGVMEAVGLAGDAHAGTRLAVLRAIDKLDRLGTEGVRDLLGDGRLDESGDFTKGAGLDPMAAGAILSFLDPAAGAGPFAEMAKAWRKEASKYHLAFLEGFAQLTPRGREGVAELAEIRRLVAAAGYGDDRITIDPACVRGLEYYTGPVFEAELTFEVKDDKGRPVRFGSVGGGGRYDGLVGRFRGEEVPATGFSVGVSRLMAALAARRDGAASEPFGPVVVTVMEKDRIADYQRLTAELRAALNEAGAPPVPVEMYLGGSGMKAQLKYADRRNAPCVVIQGSDERARGEVQVKDLVEGKRIAATIEDNAEWREARPAQVSVPVARLAETVREILARHGAHGIGGGVVGTGGTPRPAASGP